MVNKSNVFLRVFRVFRGQKFLIGYLFLFAVAGAVE